MKRTQFIRILSFFSFMVFIYLFFQQGKTSIWGEKNEEIIETEVRVESEVEEESENTFTFFSFSIIRDFLIYFQTSLLEKYHGPRLDISHSGLLNYRYLFIQVFRL